MRIVRLRYLGPMACVLALGFTTSADRITTIDGDCGTVYGGKVCTWATTSGDEVVEFGATVPIQAIEAAPADMEMVFPPVPVAVIPLPVEVAERTGFNHLTIDWEPHGHPPALFTVPHFDFHFYTVDPAAVSAVDCSDSSKPAQLPAGYALPDITIPGLGELVGLCVPAMGMHAMPAEEVDRTEPFDASMIVGYYGGNVIFLEPMIAREKLLKAEGFSMQVPKVTTAAANVRWPSSFEAVYDESTRAYRFTFSGFGG
ncbi:MAG: hypothetical protein PVJ43_06415 [Gemmatimonadales bacterium]